MFYCVYIVQVMKVHQQLAALTGKPKKKRKSVITQLELEGDDPLFLPGLGTLPVKKKTKKKSNKPQSPATPGVVSSKKSSKVSKPSTPSTATSQPKKTQSKYVCLFVCVCVRERDRV